MRFFNAYCHKTSKPSYIINDKWDVINKTLKINNYEY